MTRGDAAEFVALRAPERVRAGEVVTTGGEVVGRHDGVHRFTVGQRRGLGVAGREPRYVVSIDAETARVVVGTGDEASRDAFDVREASWVAGAPPASPRELTVKVRHRHAGERGTVSAIGDRGGGPARAARPRGRARPGRGVLRRGRGGGWWTDLLTPPPARRARASRSSRSAAA